jgi:hypothetical protein
VSNFDFTALLSGVANGTNTFALVNPSTGAPPPYDATLHAQVSVDDAAGVFVGTSSAITTIDFTPIAAYINDASTNPELGAIYCNVSMSGIALYDLVRNTSRGDTSIPVLNNEVPAYTALNDITPLSTVLNTLSSETALLDIIYWQLLTDNQSNRWLQGDGSYYSAFKEGGTLTFYVNYEAPVTTAYSLNGVSGGTVTFTGSEGSNVTLDLASLTVSSGFTVSQTYRIILTAVKFATENEEGGGGGGGGGGK